MSEAQQGELDTALIVPDFSDVKDAVEPGEYTARIVDSKFDKWAGKDGKKDTYYVAWTLETFGEAEEKNNGRKIFHRTPVNGPGAFKLKEFYKAAMNGEECPTEGGFDRTMLHGREVSLTIAPQKNQPEYNEVKLVKSVSAQH